LLFLTLVKFFAWARAFVIEIKTTLIFDVASGGYGYTMFPYCGADPLLRVGRADRRVSNIVVADDAARASVVIGGKAVSRPVAHDGPRGGGNRRMAIG
jgi:hypothetical protein